jgi:hypothetical protein
MTALQYDSTRRRLWIAGQRCHHGATGAVVTAASATALLASRATRQHAGSFIALVAAGSLLMAHDWHDRAIWFQPGHQHQP